MVQEYSRQPNNVCGLLDGKNNETSSNFSGTRTSCLDKHMLLAGMLELRLILQEVVGRVNSSLELHQFSRNGLSLRSRGIRRQI